MLKTRKQLKADLETARLAYETYVDPDPSEFIIGFFDDVEQLKAVWTVFKRSGLKLRREEFRYTSIRDNDIRPESVTTVGLFYLNPNSFGSQGIYCDVAMGFGSTEGYIFITPQKFLEMYGEDQ